eukprot:6172286-Pleurochrysis_carterae.AAC.1
MWLADGVCFRQWRTCIGTGWDESKGFSDPLAAGYLARAGMRWRARFWLGTECAALRMQYLHMNRQAEGEVATRDRRRSRCCRCSLCPKR